MPTFYVPPAIVTGAGASRELGAHAKRLGGRRALLVTDTFMVASGATEPVVALLTEAGIPTATFDGVQPDPSTQNVNDGLTALQQAEADLIVSLGGGSPIDCAKAIAILATNGGVIRDYQGIDRIPKAGVPHIALPTTAGTGSEVTRVAVITDPEHDEKMLLISPTLVPNAALVDFELSLTMPPGLTAAVGVDTLTHGIEAYVSKKANAMTDPLALSCIALCARHLRRAFHDGGNRPAREGMALAACLGGMAFSNASVALVHGMSRPLGALFHVPHGISNAMLLPVVTRYSIPGAVARYATVARTLRAATDGHPDQFAAEALVDALEALNVELGVPRLSGHPLLESARFEASLGKMATDALASGSPGNNPLVPNAEEMVELYREAW